MRAFVCAVLYAKSDQIKLKRILKSAACFDAKCKVNFDRTVNDMVENVSVNSVSVNRIEVEIYF